MVTVLKAWGHVMFIPFVLLIPWITRWARKQQTIREEESGDDQDGPFQG